MTHLYADPVFEEHQTPPGHPECPARARTVLKALSTCEAISASHPGIRPSEETSSALRLVHDPDYVASIEEAAAAGGRSLDSDTHVSARSYEVACRATATLLGATAAALAAPSESSARQAFVVVRPPGHHARPARGMGFCLFNHVAVAAAVARQGGLERVTVLDFDVHHGNGTQEMFWREGGVQYVSLHGRGYYPGTGAADETGEADGLGRTINVPLPSETAPGEYQAAFASALDRVVSFEPELILVSAGFDAYVEDPVGGLGLAAEDFHWIGCELRAAADAACGGRLVSVLEGGYDLEALGGLAQAYVEGQASSK
ncbi:MAG: histone deacetylase [Planctomycetes bacterium]|nr:histone deacetylase [Planctomycetota bacterium]